MITLDRRIEEMGVRRAGREDLLKQAIIPEVERLLLDGLAVTNGQHSVADRVARALSTGDLNQAQVAGRLSMSVATLKRRLVGESTTFRGLREEFLHGRARKMLLTDLRLERVAAELGFADVKSFSRAFKKWSGVSPHVFRVRQCAS
jgi:AraC-like DNA-binding protein